MKRITLIACEMVDGNKLELGRDENFPVCESLEDIITLQEGDKSEMTEAQIVGAFNSGNKVRKQASLRNPGKKTDTVPVATFKKLTPEQQNELLAKLAGLL